MVDACSTGSQNSVSDLLQYSEISMGKRRSHVVFVAHGQKEANLWRRYLPRLAASAGLEKDFDLTCWPDGGSFTSRHRLRDWISPVIRRAERLRRHLERPPFVDPDPSMDPDITLVSLGKGCCVAQAYILRCLSEDETVRFVRRIRQVIAICPTRFRRYRTLLVITIAATLLAFLLQIYSHFSPNSLPVEPYLATLGVILTFISIYFGIVSNPSFMEMLGFKPIRLDRDDLHRQFRDYVLEGEKNKPNTWPIPEQVLDIQDFGEDEESDATRITQAILQPPGHKNVYEVDLLERRLVISPTAAPLPMEIEVASVDNTAYLVHRVIFSEHNATSESSAIHPWELRYQSYGGKIQVHEIPNGNRWTPQERSAYQYTHAQYVFRFVPEASQAYALDATLWNGFSQGNRDSHMHLRADTYFKRLLCFLDLRPYLEAHWQVQRPPEAYFFFGRIPKARGRDRDLDGLSCDCVKNNRVLDRGIPVKVNVIEPGLYRWEVEQIRDGGILGFVFDVYSGEAS